MDGQLRYDIKPVRPPSPPPDLTRPKNTDNPKKVSELYKDFSELDTYIRKDITYLRELSRSIGINFIDKLQKDLQAIGMVSRQEVWKTANSAFVEKESSTKKLKEYIENAKIIKDFLSTYKKTTEEVYNLLELNTYIEKDITSIRGLSRSSGINFIDKLQKDLQAIGMVSRQEVWKTANSAFVEKESNTEKLKEYIENAKIIKDFLSTYKKTTEDFLKTIEEARKKKEWESEKLSSPDDSPDKRNTVETAIVGAGATATYYIASREIDPSKSIIIGMTQPWAGERGSGVISQPKYMITPKLRTTTTTTDTWMTRENFSQDIEDVLTESGIPRKNGKILNITRCEGWYKIRYMLEGEEQYIYAKNVFAGMGLGKHLPPEGFNKGLIAETDDEARTKEKRVMDMDMFSRVAKVLDSSPEERANRVIIVLGSNAGPDAVFKGIYEGYKIKWVISSKLLEGKVTLTPSNPSYAVALPYWKKRLEETNDPSEQKEYKKKIEEVNAHLGKLYHSDQPSMFKDVVEIFQEAKIEQLLVGRATKVAETEDDHMEVTLNDGKKLVGDYVVYAVGLGFDTNRVFDASIHSQMPFSQRRLKPLIDINGRFSDNSIPIGLQSDDGSLKIMGSGHTYDRTGINSTLPSSEADNVTLSALRSQVIAEGGHMPSDINKRVSYGVADRTIIAVHISSKYPSIADYKLSKEDKDREPGLQGFTYLGDALVARVIKSRREPVLSQPGDLLPPGPEYKAALPNGKAFQDYWEQAIETLNQQLKMKQLQKLTEWIEAKLSSQVKGE